MIISASRRTDIPAFYSRWLINRIRAGYCLVPNPFLPSQVATVSLAEEDVDAIVFWSRNPRPVFDYLNELDCRGYRYYFQFTLMNYPEMIDAHTPGVDRAVATFRSLAERIGPECVIWRYDPILLSETIPPDYHRASFEHIAKGLCGYTRRVVISFMDIYTKTRSRMEQLEARGTRLYPGFDVIRGDGGDLPEEAGILVRDLVEIARNCGMEIVSCAEPLNLQPFGVLSGSASIPF